jgi:chromosome condensin MukBEF ATPase and DNA-binding subunit MukB
MTATPGVEEIVRFLRRFADLMSSGHNSDHLLCAAQLIETLTKRLKEAEELAQEEQKKSENNLQLHMRAEASCANLKSQMAEVEAKLAEQQCRLNEATIDAATKEHALVPISALRHAEALFAALASEACDVVSRVMCEAGASSLDRMILESTAPSPGRTSRHAA